MVKKDKIKRGFILPDLGYSIREHELRTMEIIPEGLTSVKVLVDGVDLKDMEPLTKPKNAIITVEGYNIKAMSVPVAYKRYGVEILPSKTDRILESHFLPEEVGGVRVDGKIKMPRRWTNPPRGMVVHYHAGWTREDKIDSTGVLAFGARKGYTYWTIEEDGKTYMPHGAIVHGYHCGTGANHDHLGLEVICNGKVEPDGETYYEHFIPKEKLRTVEANGNIKAGTYEKFTPAQERSIVINALWLRERYPESFSFDRVVGHDELVSYKADPGGSLSMTMEALRSLLKELWALGVRFDTY